MSREPYYITTAISYPNGKPHIGHAYEAIAADAIARFHRLSGRDVRFQTGTDEHGLKMVQTAREKGVDVRDLSRDMSDQFQAMCDKLNISYDHFQRTTDPAHHKASVAIWEAMKANGDLYLDRYEGWYSVRDEAFYEEKELSEGEGGARLSPQGTPVEWTVEESWFFKLSKYEKPLLELYEKKPDFVRPESRRNEVVRFVEGGLRDLSISRTSFDWGVKVPGSPDHVMYVWVDALTNYLTGLGYPDMDGDMAKYWPANLHLIGKDIVRFHAVYWPAFLMSAGLPLPRQVFGHGFLLARGGEKMSKSLGNVVDPIDLADRYGVDALRYFFLREVSFGSDGTWSEEAIVTRCNAELANSFGNLAQRVLSFIAKNLDGELPLGLAEVDQVVPMPSHLAKQSGLDPNDRSPDRTFKMNLLTTYSEKWEKLDIGGAVELWMLLVQSCNKAIDHEAPWTLRKTDPNKMNDVLASLVRSIRHLAIAIIPVVPKSAHAALDQLGVPESERDFDALRDPSWYVRLVNSGHRITAPTPIFPRLDLPVEVEA